MSYSRWSISVWYSFHNCASGSTIDSQVLSLWGLGKVLNFTYDELKGIRAIDIMALYDDCAKENAMEAITYIEEFCEDCEEEFKVLEGLK